MHFYRDADSPKLLLSGRPAGRLDEQPGTQSEIRGTSLSPVLGPTSTWDSLCSLVRQHRLKHRE